MNIYISRWYLNLYLFDESSFPRKTGFTRFCWLSDYKLFELHLFGRVLGFDQGLPF